MTKKLGLKLELSDSQRCREKAGYREGIKHYHLLADPKPLAVPMQPIAIESSRKQPRFTFLLSLIDTKRSLGEQSIRADCGDTRDADDVAIGVDVVFAHDAQRLNAVLQHPSRITVDQRRRKVPVDIFLGHHVVGAILGEQTQPFVVLSAISVKSIIREQTADSEEIGTHRCAPTGSMPRISA